MILWILLPFGFKVYEVMKKKNKQKLQTNEILK